MPRSPNERTRPQVGTGSESNGQKLGSIVSPATPELRYVVHIDLTPALDKHGHLDEHEATAIVYRSSDFPAGATVRLFIGSSTFSHLDRIAKVLEKAGTIEISGSSPRGMRHLGDALNGIDPYAALQVVR